MMDTQIKTVSTEPTLAELQELQERWVEENREFFKTAEKVARNLGQFSVEPPRFDIGRWHYQAGDTHIYLFAWEGVYHPKYNQHRQCRALHIHAGGEMLNKSSRLVCLWSYDALDGAVTCADPLIVPGRWMDAINAALSQAEAIEAGRAMTAEQVQVETMKQKLCWGMNL